MEDIFQFCGPKLEPGTLYAALVRLERRGWIEVLEAEDRRHPYSITAAGEVALREQLKTLHRVVSACPALADWKFYFSSPRAARWAWARS
jgi:DNA-binding PadR family transcriptional regulator